MGATDIAGDPKNPEKTPGMIRVYEKHDAPFPWEFIQEMAKINVCGITVPQEYGGAGMDNLAEVLAVSEIAYGWPAGALVINVGATLTGDPIRRDGTKEQKRRWLPDLAAGKIVGAFGLTEANAGSDTSAIATRAEQQSDGWQINGSKRFITCGPHASFVILIAKTNVGITAFAIPCDRSPGNGFVSLPPEHKEGQHAAHLGELIFTDYLVPLDSVLGKIGQGVAVYTQTLEHGRTRIGAQAIGILKQTLRLAAERARNRYTFGQPLISHSAIYDILTKLALAIDVSQLLVWHAAILEDQGKEFGPYASMAKFFSSEAAARLTVEAAKIYGGQGYLYDEEINQLKRAATVLPTYEGATGIQCSIILKAWFRGGLELQVPQLGTRLDELKQKVLKHLGRENVLSAENQRLPFRAADVLPLITAWRLASEEHPRDLMTFNDPAILPEMLLEKIKKKFPATNQKSNALWGKAFKNIRI